jgi:hypothetical protein
MKMPVLATREQIQTLYERAEALLDALLEDEKDESLRGPLSMFSEAARERDRRLRNAVETLRFCAIAAGFLGDPALVSLVAAAIRSASHFDEYPYDHTTVMGSALTRVLCAGAPADETVAALARHPSEQIRAALAGGLRPSGAAETELLELLAADAHPNVRANAKKALAQVREVPWWVGKLKQDPTARIPPEEVNRVQPVLKRVSALLDQPRYHLLGSAEGREALTAELAALPDALAVEIVEHLGESLDHTGLRQAQPLFTHVLSREHGAAALARLVERWGADPITAMSAGRSLTAAVKEGPMDGRRALCRALVERAARASIEERLQRSGPAHLAAEIAGEVFPPDDDVTSLLDALLEMGTNEASPYDLVQSALALALRSIREGTPAFARLLEACLGGYPGPWKSIRHTCDSVLERASPQVLRDVAERALAVEDETTAAWALEQLLGPTYDEARDGAPIKRIRALWSDPRLRSALRSSVDLRKKSVLLEREALRRGELDFPLAARAIQSIGVVYGGVVLRGPPRAQMEELRLSGGDDADEGVPPELEPWLGPEEMRGPPTAEEWARLREARARHTPEDQEERASLWYMALSDGPFTEDERAELTALLVALRRGDTRIAFFLTMALASKPAPDFVVEHGEEILSLAEPRSRDYLGRIHAATLRWLKLPVRGAEAPPAPEAAPAEDWVDEPD